MKPRPPYMKGGNGRRRSRDRKASRRSVRNVTDKLLQPGINPESKY